MDHNNLQDFYKEKGAEGAVEIRTDLAIEAGEMLGKDRLPQGVLLDTEDRENTVVTRIEIRTKEASDALGKKQGRYVTVELREGELNTLEIHREVAETVRDELAVYLDRKRSEHGPTVMIVGLGNRYITPDALGPKVVEKIVVTRHVRQNPELAAELDKRLGTVCAIAPGVLGITGIETGEIIQGLVEKIKPDILLAIDALAARKTSRINTTVQIADTGIVPGSGIGNRRMALSEETLGIPVISIGVPTVVDAMTLARDLIEEATGQELRRELEENMGRTCGAENIVTPKNIDMAVERMANAISNGLNMALHRGFDFNDVSDYLI